MLIKLIPTSEDVEASDGGWWFRPLVIFKCSNRKELYYYCGRGKLFDRSNQAIERAERFISLYHKFAEEGPPKKEAKP